MAKTLVISIKESGRVVEVDLDSPDLETQNMYALMAKVRAAVGILLDAEQPDPIIRQMRARYDQAVFSRWTNL